MLVGTADPFTERMTVSQRRYDSISSQMSYELLTRAKWESG